MFKAYYNLTKPGIIYGNVITTIAGFFLASKGHVHWFLFLATLVGISFVIGSACVFNNLFDRDIDDRMERTKNRALVTGKISKLNASIYAGVLAVIGFIILQFHTNLLATLIAFVGFFVYVFLYTPLKRQSIHATLVGSIAGAVPIVAGYCAVTNRFDLGAFILFLILVTWQMPHFYAIAIRRLDDYQRARIPVLPARKGVFYTKINMLCYIIAFMVATILLAYFKYTGLLYLIVMLLLGLAWGWFCIEGFKSNVDSKIWARKMFLFSLVVILIFSLTVSIGAIINK